MLSTNPPSNKMSALRTAPGTVKTPLGIIDQVLGQRSEQRALYAPDIRIALRELLPSASLSAVEELVQIITQGFPKGTTSKKQYTRIRLLVSLWVQMNGFAEEVENILGAINKGLGNIVAPTIVMTEEEMSPFLAPPEPSAPPAALQSRSALRPSAPPALDLQPSAPPAEEEDEYYPPAAGAGPLAMQAQANAGRRGAVSSSAAAVAIPSQNDDGRLIALLERGLDESTIVRLPPAMQNLAQEAWLRAYAYFEQNYGEQLPNFREVIRDARTKFQIKLENAQSSQAVNEARSAADQLFSDAVKDLYDNQVTESFLQRYRNGIVGFLTVIIALLQAMGLPYSFSIYAAFIFLVFVFGKFLPLDW